MADEYIKRDAAYNYLTEYYNHRTDIQHQNLRKALNAIPSADVQPVTYGEWKLNEFSVAECSVCHKFIGIGIFTDAYNFCPNCGARMDGE